MPEPIDCPRCWGTGWIAHDCHCPDCDGYGEIDPEDAFDEDRVYDEWKDNQLTENYDPLDEDF